VSDAPVPPPLKDVPINFLLNCADTTLGDFQLMRLNAVAELRKQLIAIVDQMVEEMAKAALASWFRGTDRELLKSAIENPESVVEWAKQRIREMNRDEDEMLPMPPPDPEAVKKAHRIAAVTYQSRNLAEGKCRSCPKPLALGSVLFCEEHLAKVRVRERTKKGLAGPGSREYLYAGEISEQDTRPRSPGLLTTLALNREKKTRALLAELGVPPESAAITLNAAKEALLKVMPEHEGLAMDRAQLFAAAIVPSVQTGGKALNELLAEGKIQRTGRGIRNDPHRYFL
jgi:hypothetical protein